MGIALLLVSGAAACGSSDATDDTAAEDATSAETGTGTEAAETTPSPELDELVAEVQPEFEQAEYVDEETGEALPYNIYLPQDYDESEEYPVVLYIPGSSLVGDDVTAPLGEYGALIWADPEQQATQESIVVVPAYPEVILDDHDGYTTTEYVDMTERLLGSIIDEYSVDEDRVYGTGQSMGCMTIMYLAAQNPDLFTAELFVSGQWDASELEGLADETFFYIAAEGDENASGGQADVQAVLDGADVPYGTAMWDATAPEDELNAAALELLSDGYTANFATFEEGTVLEANPDAMNMEHMASFEPAYKIGALRDWLLSQTDEDRPNVRRARPGRPGAAGRFGFRITSPRRAVARRGEVRSSGRCGRGSGVCRSGGHRCARDRTDACPGALRPCRPCGGTGYTPRDQA